jgi:hypothetical protein
MDSHTEYDTNAVAAPGVTTFASLEQAQKKLDLLSSALQITGIGLTALVLAILFLTEMNDTSISIEPFTVPDPLAESGFTAQASAIWLRGELQTIAHSSWGDGAAQLDVDAPGSADVTIPGVGLSLGALAHGTAKILGIGQRHQIEGLFTLRGGKLYLQLLYDQQCLYNTSAGDGVDPQHPEVLLTVGARAIVNGTNPVALANYVFSYGDPDTARVLAQKITSSAVFEPWSHKAFGQAEKDRILFQQRQAYVLLGRIADKAHDYAGAARSYGQAIGLGADNSFVRKKRADACAALKKTPCPT